MRHAAPSGDLFLVRGFGLVRRAAIFGVLREPQKSMVELQLKREGE